MIFCCVANCPVSAVEGMFLRISWRWVVNVVSDISTMSTPVRIFVLTSEEPRKWLDRGAPKSVDCSMTPATDRVIGPIGVCWPAATCGRLLSTWKSAKKNGDCSRIGRHEENGFVPVSL